MPDGEGLCFFLRGAFLRPFSRVGGRQCVRSGGMFFLQSPYPQHFFHAANPPFVKKFRAPERIGYQGTAIFAQPPPPPCRRARRRADNPADKPVCNTDNRIHRTRRSQTTACIGVRRTHAVHPTVGSLPSADADCPPPTYPRTRRRLSTVRRAREFADADNAPSLQIAS